jgi:TRAP-type C4-dicarboxylate transport system permease small subunit
MTAITTLSRYAGVFGAALMAVTGLMLTYEVIARYFFVKPTVWAAELSQLCLIWGCMLAMPYVLTLQRHITVNAVTNLLPRRGQRVCAALALALVILFSVIVAYWGWTIFWDSFERGRTTGSILNLPIAITEFAIPFGFGLLALQAGVELARLRNPEASFGGATHE